MELSASPGHPVTSQPAIHFPTKLQDCQFLGKLCSRYSEPTEMTDTGGTDESQSLPNAEVYLRTQITPLVYLTAPRIRNKVRDAFLVTQPLELRSRPHVKTAQGKATCVGVSLHERPVDEWLIPRNVPSLLRGLEGHAAVVRLTEVVEQYDAPFASGKVAANAEQRQTRLSTEFVLQ